MSLLNFEHWNRFMKAFKNISICLILITSQLGLVASAQDGGDPDGVVAGAALVGVKMLENSTVQVGKIVNKIEAACKASQTQSSDGQTDDQSDGGTAASGCTLTTTEQETLKKAQTQASDNSEYCNCVDSEETNCSEYLANAKALNEQIGLLNKSLEYCCPNITSEVQLPLKPMSLTC